MNIEQIRAEFESFMRKRYPDVSLKMFATGCYLVSEARHRWEGWQARATLQSQHDEETKRLRDALKLARDRARGFMNDSGADTDSLPEIDAAIDHARHIEGEAQ